MLPVSNLGQNAALQKFLPEYSVRDPARGRAILINTVILVSAALAIACLAFFLTSGWMAAVIYRTPSLTRVFQFSALLVLSLSLFNLASSATAGLQDFKTYSRVMIIRSGAFLLFAWLGVRLLGLYGALLGQLIASLIGLALLTAAVVRLSRRRFPGSLRPHFSAGILREILSFSVPALLASVLVAPAYWWANTVLVRHWGFERAGLFSVAFAIAQLIVLVPSTLSVPAVSFMSEAHTRKAGGGFTTLVRTNLRLIWSLTLPLTVGCMLFTTPMIGLLFGSRYHAARMLVFPMSITALLIIINGVIGAAITGSGKMWNGFLLNLCWLAIFLFSGVIFIPKWGALGTAVTFVVSYAFFTIAVGVYSHVALRVRYEKLGSLLGITLVGLGVGGAGSFYLGGPMWYAAAFLLLMTLVLAEWKYLLSDKERSLLSSLLVRNEWRNRCL